MEKLKFYKNLDLADIVYFDEELGEFLTEQWKDIIGYENYYQASNIGRVKSLERYVKGAQKNKRLLKSRIKVLQLRKVGYLIIKFCKDGIETSNDILCIQSYIDYSFQENYDEALEEDEDNSDSKFIYDYLETVLSYQRKRKHEWDNEKKTVYSLFIKNN